VCVSVCACVCFCVCVCMYSAAVVQVVEVSVLNSHRSAMTNNFKKNFLCCSGVTVVLQWYNCGVQVTLQ
jgi:hypothetical protein